MTLHAIDRARERYGVVLTPDDITAMKWQIINGSSVRVSSSPHGSELHMVRHGGSALLARWHDAQIVTFEPADALTKSGRRARFRARDKGRK